MGNGSSKNSPSFLCLADVYLIITHSNRIIVYAPWMHYWFPECYAYHVNYAVKHPGHPLNRKEEEDMDNDGAPSLAEAVTIAQARGRLPAIIFSPVFILCKFLLCHLDIIALTNLLNEMIDEMEKASGEKFRLRFKSAGDAEAQAAAKHHYLSEVYPELMTTRRHYAMTHSTHGLTLSLGYLFWSPLIVGIALRYGFMSVAIACIGLVAIVFWCNRSAIKTVRACAQVLATYVQKQGGWRFVQQQIQLFASVAHTRKSKPPPPEFYGVEIDDNTGAARMTVDPKTYWRGDVLERDPISYEPIVLRPVSGRAPPPGFVEEKGWASPSKKIGRTLENKLSYKYGGRKDIPKHARSFTTPNPPVWVTRWVREQWFDALEEQLQQEQVPDRDQDQDQEQSEASIVSNHHLAREDSGFEESSAGSEASSSPCIEALDRLVFGRSPSSSSLSSICSVLSSSP